MVHYFLLAPLLFISHSFATELKVAFDHLRNDKGVLRYLVFNNEKGFPDKPEKGFLRGDLSAANAKEGISLDVPDGSYSVTVIHDEDGNGKLDKNFMGMPKEGFGFSNDPRIFFGPPSFERTVFKVEGAKQISIKVKYL